MDSTDMHPDLLHTGDVGEGLACGILVSVCSTEINLQDSAPADLSVYIARTSHSRSGSRHSAVQIEVIVHERHARAAGRFNSS